MPLWQRYYDEKGKLIREMRYSEIKTFGKRAIPAVIELVPLNKKGFRFSEIPGPLF